jgi:hypothetical protein
MSVLPSSFVPWRASLQLALALLLVSPVTLRAQEPAAAPDTQGLPADILAAHTFLLAAYPDLVDRSLQVQARRDDDGVVVSVTDLAEPRVDGVAVPLVTARFQFDSGARLRRFDGYGPLLREVENLALQDELVKNPRWIESDADVWLTQRGVPSTFAAPSAAVASRTAVIAERIGAQAVGGGRFEWHTGHTSAAGGRVFRSRPAWVTEAVGVDANGAPLIYQFEYEPFSGRLIVVTVLEAQ